MSTGQSFYFMRMTISVSTGFLVREIRERDIILAKGNRATSPLCAVRQTV
jgi:hypothetical protein